MAPLVLPSHTRSFPPEDLEIAREVAERVVKLVDDRRKYVETNNIDPAFAYPDANWAYDAPNAFVSIFKRVARCDVEAVGQFRAFTQVFTGLNLYEMEIGLPPSDSLEHYNDDVIASKLSLDCSYIEEWQRLTEHAPFRCIFSPPRRFGEIGYDFRGIIINPDTLTYQWLINLLLEGGIIAWLDSLASSRRSIKILEIGAGYGALGFWFRSSFPNCSYTIIDLPECLLFSGLYLSLALPDIRTGWGLEAVPFGLRFLPNYQADFLQEGFDLIINTLSMSEMSVDQVRQYVRLMKSFWMREGGIFFEQNADNRHIELLRVEEIFSTEFPTRKRLNSVTNLWSLEPLF